MSGNKCVYYKCGKSRRTNPHLVMHRFPVKDEKRSKKWIKNCGNTNLVLLLPEQLRCKYICNEHFLEEDFLGPDKRLKRSAIPIPYSSNQSKVQTLSQNISRSVYPNQPGPSHVLEFPHTPQKIVSPKALPNSPATQQWLVDISDLPSPQSSTKIKRKLFCPSDVDTPTKKRLKSAVQNLKKKLAYKTSLLSKSKKKILFTADFKNILERRFYVSSQSRALVRMQLLHTKKSSWLKDERDFALGLYFKSPATYKMLRTQLILPSVSVIKQWIGKKSFFRTGFNEVLLTDLKLKINSMSQEERYCTLCFDEMSIKKYLEYSKAIDVIEGFQDLGTLGRTNKLAKEALVFVARGLYAPWKIPLCYFLSASATNHRSLKDLIIYVIGIIKEIGLVLKALVCDQGTNNRSAITSLGVVDTNEPYFFYQECKYFVIYDVPHLFKSLRNNLLSGNFVLQNKIISFKSIVKTFDIDQKCKLGARSLLKITPAHLNPNAFQKLSVKLAVQIFSNSVAAAIRTAVQSGDLDDDTATATAEFLQRANNLFDCLNSVHLYSKNRYNCALSKKNPVVETTLHNSLEIFKKIQKFDVKSKKFSRPPSFDGFLISINAILMLYKEEEERGKDYILTSRLNQDVIENFFSIVRQRGGYNKNPTARMFRLTFRSLSLSNILKPFSSYSNCCQDTDIFVTDEFETSKIIDKEQLNIPSTSIIEKEAENMYSAKPDAEEVIEITVSQLEDCSITYFAGYLGKRLFDTYRCADCDKELMKQDLCLEDKSQLLILNRLYQSKTGLRSLRAPNELLKTVCHVGLKVFIKLFSKIYFEENLKFKLVNAILSEINQKNIVFDIEDNIHGPHKNFIIEALVTARIFSECKQLNKNVATNTYLKKHDKLKIIKHI